MCSTNGQNSSAQAQGGGGLDEHNLHRINTMSEAALQRRIYKIQRCDKLQSFVEVSMLAGQVTYSTYIATLKASVDGAVSFKRHILMVCRF
jgi:hypothetical protein